MNDPSWLTRLGIGVVVFASTNIDDIVLLAAFFADRHLLTRHIVIGQFLGIGVLTAASAIAALAALAVPASRRATR
jgi:cadmium resistance protein CadD (predicted permease)